jgi:anti-anti-sigma regulatory factor
MPAVRHIAVRLLGRRRQRRSPQPHRAGPTSAEAPRTVAELRSRGLAVVSSVGYGIYCIDVNGDLNLATAGLLDTAAAAVHAPDPAGRAEPNLIILDLADVTFLDAVGVVALHRAHGLVRGRAEVRVDLPDHRGPRSMLRVATDQGWLAPVFRPDDTVARDLPLRATAT